MRASCNPLSSTRTSCVQACLYVCMCVRTYACMYVCVMKVSIYLAVHTRMRATRAQTWYGIIILLYTHICIHACMSAGQIPLLVGPDTNYIYVHIQDVQAAILKVMLLYTHTPMHACTSGMSRRRS